MVFSAIYLVVSSKYGLMVGCYGEKVRKGGVSNFVEILSYKVDPKISIFFSFLQMSKLVVGLLLDWFEVLIDSGGSCNNFPFILPDVPNSSVA